MELFQKLKAKDVLESAKKENNVQDAVLRECGKISARLAPALLLQQGRSSQQRGKYAVTTSDGWMIVQD